MRDIFFNLAFAAYVGGFFNLNPFIERDGYHILVDVLREPGLRRRAKEQLARRLRGEGARRPTRRCSRATASAGSAGRCWRRCFAIAMSLRYETICPDVLACRTSVVYGVHGDALGGVLPAGDLRVRQAAASSGGAEG